MINATSMDAAGLPTNSVLKAYQGANQGNCNLTINTGSVEKGSGDLCLRLNIVREGALVHIYLPADIPNTGSSSAAPPQPKYVVFGMDADMYANFKQNMVTNGSKIALSTLGDAQNLDLVAYQNQMSASCMIGKSGDTLSIVPNTGLLCGGGLVLITQKDGDYFIGLPNQLPVPAGSQAYGLGIAQGMSVTIQQQTVRWDSQDKTVYLPEGDTHVIITGNNKEVRDCVVTRYGDSLKWPATPACQGVVVNSGILYFPAF